MKDFSASVETLVHQRSFSITTRALQYLPEKSLLLFALYGVAHIMSFKMTICMQYFIQASKNILVLYTNRHHSLTVLNIIFQ